MERKRAKIDKIDQKEWGKHQSKNRAKYGTKLNKYWTKDTKLSLRIYLVFSDTTQNVSQAKSRWFDEESWGQKVSSSSSKSSSDDVRSQSYSHSASHFKDSFFEHEIQLWRYIYRKILFWLHAHVTLAWKSFSKFSKLFSNKLLKNQNK